MKYTPILCSVYSSMLGGGVAVAVMVVVVVVVRNRVDWPQTAMNLPSNCTGSVCNVEYVCVKY